MSKAAELAALIGSQTALSNRNLIINGAMQVAQRGTSETSVTTAGYRNACDRFRVGGNNGTWTISQDTDAPDGFSNSFKMLLTATESIGGTSYWAVEQRIEGQNLQGLAYGTSSAKTVTVSFYVKSNVTGTYCLNLYQDDGTKNFPKTYTIDSANTWERKTISFVGDTATALDNDNAKSLRTIFFQVAGSSHTSGTPGSRVAYTDATFAAGHTAQIDAVNDYWQITGLQLEVGEQATPFEHRSYADELLACQRYYEIITVNGYFVTGNSYSTGQMNCAPMFFRTTKRATPTITYPTIGTTSGTIGPTDSTANYVGTMGSVLRSYATDGFFQIYNSASDGYSGFTDDGVCQIYSYGDNDITVDAEL